MGLTNAGIPAGFDEAVPSPSCFAIAVRSYPELDNLIECFLVARPPAIKLAPGAVSLLQPELQHGLAKYGRKGHHMRAVRTAPV
jgi:hypothetical protein